AAAGGRSRLASAGSRPAGGSAVLAATGIGGVQPASPAALCKPVLPAAGHTAVDGAATAPGGDRPAGPAGRRATAAGSLAAARRRWPLPAAGRVGRAPALAPGWARSAQRQPAAGPGKPW